MRLVQESPRAQKAEVPTALPPGQIIAGTRYRVLAKIGEGAMGEVHMAEHVDLEKRVALKLLHASFARQPEAVERFRQEARAASRIGNPYICDVTDFGQMPDGRVFFVMEYLEGHSLRAVVGTQGHIAASRAIGILRQVCKALGAAHEKGIIHLDVKPDNIMVRELRRRPDAVKIVDFGIAGLMHTQGREDKISGTPEYIAPERALGRGYGHCSDIYSLGVTTYELLTGHAPFHDPDVTTMLRKHVHEVPVPLRQRAPEANIPPELETLVLQMLAKDPAARPQNMAVVEAMLCEAQIAAKITTPWDDLELPAVDEVWHKKLTARMPSPHGAQRKAVALGAIAVAFAAVAVALYFGVFQAPKIEYRYNEVTKTQEAASVQEWLFRAGQASRAQKYTGGDESALYFLEMADAEAAKLPDGKSNGAKLLRRAYADALVMLGNQLHKADLQDLAIAKYKEALLFEADDPEIQKKAELTPADRKAYLERRARAARAASSSAPPVPVAPKVQSPEEQANTVAANAFIAATSSRTSEARAGLRRLSQLDPSGMQAAKMADALRAQARVAWSNGKYQEARAYYTLVSDVDSKDLEAKDRSRPEAVPAPPPTAPSAPVSPAEIAVIAAGANKKSTDYAVGPREAAQSQAASSQGMTALTKGKLADAEAAFNRAVRFNPLNAVAVGGLAEVAFERARYPEALDYGRSAIKLDPQASRYLVVVGDAYFKLLRYKDAEQAYLKARKLTPDDERIKGRLDRVKAKLGTR